MTMIKSDLFSFGALLKTFRTRCHLTQQQLATALGMHRHAIGRWEQGDHLPESKTLVLELARHLKLGDQETRQLLEASLTALAPHWSVPLSRNPLFTGREEILGTLHAQLGIEQAVALTQSSALHGLGGVGKTQIALEYAYRHALEYSAVFWIGAETDEQVITSLQHIAEVLQLPERKDTDEQRAVAAVQRWLSTHGQWLLIWDNVEDLAQLDRFLPTARSGAILLTTRTQALGARARGLDLLPMEQEEGLLFLLRRAKVFSPEVTDEQVCQFAVQAPLQYTAASELVMVLGGLPLALDQAGAYLEETHCGVSAYLELFRNRRDALLQRRGEGLQDHPASVSTTFILAITAAAERHPAVKDLLQVCAFLQPDAIPEELFRQGGKHLGAVLEAVCRDPLEWDRVIGLACSYSLLSRQSEEQTLSMHRLVQAVLLDTMTEAEREQQRLRIIRSLDVVFPDIQAVTKPEVWRQCERLLPHVLACATILPDQAADQEVLADVLRKVADHLSERAQYEQAEPLYQRALHIYEQVLGPEHLSLIRLFHSLTVLYLQQGKYAQAQILGEKVLHIREQALGPLHLDVATSLNTLANIYSNQGKYEQAEPMFQRALSIREQILGPEHPDLGSALNNLAVLSFHQGKYEQAELLYQRAVHIWMQTLGPQHPRVAGALSNLAFLYVEQKKYEQAEPLYQRALHIWERTLGSEHPDLGSALNNLAILYFDQGKYEQAEPLYQRALHIWTQALGPEHPRVAELLNNLANLSQKQGKDEQAEAFYLQALRIHEQNRGEDHPETAQTLHDFSVFQQKRGNLSEAASFAERALKIRLQSLGDTHPKTATTQALYTQLIREQEAEIEPTLKHLRTLLKARGWSLHLKKRRGKPYVYATRKVGQRTHSRYLAPLSDPVACLAAASTLPNAKEA